MSDIAAEPYQDYSIGRISPLQVVKQVLVLLFLTAAIAYFFLPGSARSRFIISIGSVIIPGFISASMISLALFEGLAKGYFSWQTHWLIFIIFFSAIAITLFTGRNFYCSNFCPFGSAQYLMAKIHKKKRRPGKKITFFLQGFRIILIAAAFTVVIADAGISLSFFEPFKVFRWNYSSWFSRILALSFLFLSVIIQRPWCRICPTGGIIEGISKFSRRFL